MLLDELADYCVGAAAVPVGDTTLADQTISFITQLTEAVQQVPGAVVVATLPASRLEVAQSEKGQEAFMALEKRFQRLGADLKPVADDEIYEVVRARLFETVTPPSEADYPRKVAAAYHKLYADHASEVPADAAKATYRERLERAYPFHPTVIDALYTRWGSHPDFQRTRGVLRLLASVVANLWERRQGSTETQHFIQPCHIRWSIDAMQAALTRLWGAGYQSVAAADLTDQSNSAGFDEERGGDYRREGIAQGLASAILLGSFGGQGERSGYSARDLKLACSRSGLNWSYTDGALLELEDRCFYLHQTSAGSLGKRYWFGVKPTLNKLVVQYRQHNAGKSFDTEILDSLKGQSREGTGDATWRVLVDPDEDLSEQKSLTLLILPPAVPWSEDGDGANAASVRVRELSSRCGKAERKYRNTLVFLAARGSGLNKLRQAHRELAALQQVQSDFEDQLDVAQKDELTKRILAAEKSTREALAPAYTVAFRVCGSELETVNLSDALPTFKEHLGYLWKVLVEEEEWIVRRVGSVALRKAGLISEDGALRLKDAVDAFLRYTDKPVLVSRNALTEGLAQACRDGQVGIGYGTGPSTLQKRVCGQSVSLDPSEDGVWIIPAFVPRPETSPSSGGVSGAAAPTGPAGIAVQLPVTGHTASAAIAAAEGAAPASAGQKAARLTIQGSVPVESWADLFRCFVGPAARMNLSKLHLGVAFELTAAEGEGLDIDSASLKGMKESARQLGLTFSTEE